ncbi:hypothetical protein JCM19000A_25420 [Silvimonas sp. JCM 19000]
MPEAHYAEYEAFAALEPIGMHRADFNTGLMVANIMSALAGGKHAPRDYMPFQHRREEMEFVDEFLMQGDVVIG